MNIHQSRQQSGFTLIEIAIVMVIIGLLLGGVLKGAQLIDNSKVKRAVGDLNGVAAAYHSYRDRYRRIPGDDGNLATIQARGGEWTRVPQAGNNNGALASTLANTYNGGGESDNFWMHLAASGFIAGDPAVTGANALPRNSFNGAIGVTAAAVGGGLTGIKVCLSQVPGVAAASLDQQLDDGDGAAGNMRATLGTAGTNTAPVGTALVAGYNEANEYTVCMRL